MEAIIRRDITERGLKIPIGHYYTNSKRKFEYKWIDEKFYVHYRNKWYEAQSVDFEFLK